MKRAYGLMLIVILVAGCAASRTQVLQPKKAEFQNYSILEITDLKTNVGAQVPSELLQTLPDTIADKVRNLNLFQAVNRVSVEAEAAPATKTLVLQGTVIEYEPGSRALRWLIGFGAGKAFVTVQLTAIDKVTREEIFKGNIGGEQSMGIFGGSINEVIQKIADESVECIQMNYAAEERVASLPQKTTETPTAASAPAEVNRMEPWTGLWRVEGDRLVIGQWAMKQSGTLVKSTTDSFYEIKGKAEGNQLKGTVIGDYDIEFPFILDLSSDGLTFEGKLGRRGSRYITGKRKRVKN